MPDLSQAISKGVKTLLEGAEQRVRELLPDDSIEEVLSGLDSDSN
ncbi:hypothetical protein [Halorarius litoreus]|nr:hypothetical protein [Halorarius litoreus]